MKKRSSTRPARRTSRCSFAAFRAARRRAGPRAGRTPRPERAMTNSRSKASTSRLRLALVVLCAVAGMAGAAHAGRRRVVVLGLDGPTHERVHDDLVTLINKTHTVISTD